MKKNIIFSIMIGDDPMYNYAEKAMRSYAEKTSSALYIMRQPDLRPPQTIRAKQKHTAWYQKKYIFNLLEKYERVLYVDADILITPGAENIFTSYTDPELDTLYMFDERTMRRSNNPQSTQDSKTTDYEQGPIKIHGVQHQEAEKASLALGKKLAFNRMFNGGVILIAKNCPLQQVWSDAELAKLESCCVFYEQTYINWLIENNNIKTISLDESFNRTGFLDTPTSWDQINFIHFAVGSHFNSRTATRPYYLRQLYLKLYGKQESIINTYKFYTQYLKLRVQRKIKKFLKR